MIYRLSVIMTPNLTATGFTREELSMMKMLVIESLLPYSDCEQSNSGHIHELLLQLRGKLEYLQEWG